VSSNISGEAEPSETILDSSPINECNSNQVAKKLSSSEVSPPSATSAPSDGITTNLYENGSSELPAKDNSPALDLTTPSSLSIG
jgi:hypothetical protein